jgi:thiamine-phosphate pyrophosphorylase
MEPTWPRRGSLPRGLYLITPDESDSARLLARVAPLLPHVACLQYRNKTASVSLRRQQAEALRSLCSDAGVLLIINDDAALAAAAGADGVHLGEHDGAFATARALLGNEAIIGVSCYDDAVCARNAAALGADYVAFGAFYPSPTKPRARRASIDLLRESRALGLPRVAIGGITPDNAPVLIAAGADMIAVISGVFDASDPLAAARAYSACFD